MKKLKQLLARQRIDARHQAGCGTPHRRLRFERCEERLTLSGSSVVPVDTTASEGGFIALDAGDYIRTSASDFIATDSSLNSRLFGDSSTWTIYGADRDLDMFSSFSPGMILVDFVDYAYSPFGLVALTEITPATEVEIGSPVGIIDSASFWFDSLSQSGDTLRTFITSDFDLQTVAPVIEPEVIESVISTSDTELPSFVITSENSLPETVSTTVPNNEDFQSDIFSNVVDLNSDPLREESLDTSANQPASQETLVGPFAVLPELLLSETVDFLRFSDATLTDATRDISTLNDTARTHEPLRVDSILVLVDKSLSIMLEEGIDTSESSQESVAKVDRAREPSEVEVENLASGSPLLVADEVKIVDVADADVVGEEEGDQTELSRQRGEEFFAYSAEGGPIEVALAMANTQQAYEAKVFSAVLARIDNGEMLVLPTPPVQQLLSGELARSVAFELVELESTNSLSHINESPLSSMTLPISPGAIPQGHEELSARVESSNDNEAIAESSRGLAFAQWPLVYPATIGAVLLGFGRRSQSSRLKRQAEEK